MTAFELAIIRTARVRPLRHSQGRFKSEWQFARLLRRVCCRLKNPGSGCGRPVKALFKSLKSQCLGAYVCLLA